MVVPKDLEAIASNLVGDMPEVLKAAIAKIVQAFVETNKCEAPTWEGAIAPAPVAFTVEEAVVMNAIAHAALHLLTGTEPGDVMAPGGEA